MTKYIRIAAITVCLMAIFCVSALANTDGTEVPIAEEPDMLVIQLGKDWAGVEFELKTDAGLFPAPVVVDSSGLLTMELGGSKSYILSCIPSAVTPPTPQFEDDDLGVEEVSDDDEELSPPEVVTDKRDSPVIPAKQLIIFGSGMVICITALVVMQIRKRRYEEYDYDDEDDYDEDDDG